MDNFLNNVGGAFEYITNVLLTSLGGYDLLLQTMITFAILDYLTEALKSLYMKEVSTGVGFKGIIKKILIFIIIALTVSIQGLFGDNVELRSTIMIFFITNEGISIVENSSKFIPVPDKIKESLLKFKNMK